MQKLLGLALLLAVTPVAHAADIEAGKRLAVTVCAACHGANGVSVSEAAPNLAAQRAGYVETQLKAFRDGTRKGTSAMSPAVLMEAIASQLGAEDIANVAAYLASLPGAAPGAKSDLMPNFARSQVTFPDSYKDAFTRYLTMNFPATRQVRVFYANALAAAAAKAGRPLPDGSVLFVEVFAAKLDANGKPVTGADGFYVADKLLVYTAMASGAGWGDDIPDMLRNANWNYTVFTTDKQQRAGVNQADCLACHKPLDKASYAFTLKQLSEAK